MPDQLPHSPSNWLSRAPTRLKSHFWLKCVGTPLFMTGFFVAYFTVLRHPPSPPLTIPTTAPDRWIAFQPLALIPYVSLWVYVTLPASLIVVRRELLSHTIGAFALSVIGLAIFVIWPTTAPTPDIDWTLHPTMQFLKNVDASGNACPSLHAAFAVFACLWLARQLNECGAGRLSHGLNYFWAATIVYSTVATRQHVAIDAITGALLGWLVAHINLRFPPAPIPCPVNR